MCSDVLNSPNMVLNKSWLPISILRTKDAFCKVFSGMAKIIDENFVQYDWDEWVEISQNGTHPEGTSFVQTPRYKVKVPTIIKLTYYNRVPKTDVKLTRRNILVRDRHQCQYCGKKVSSRDATLDHIMPKSRGGKTSWTNLVTCCERCNVKKGNKTPHEAGVKLLRVPKKPEWSPIYSKFVNRVPETWSKFVKSENIEDTDGCVPSDDNELKN